MWRLKCDIEHYVANKSMRFVSNRKGVKGDKNNLYLWHIMNGSFTRNDEFRDAMGIFKAINPQIFTI